MVLGVRAQVLGELVDPLGEQRNLDLGGAGVAIGATVPADQLAFLFLGQAHLKKTPRSGRRSRPLEASTDALGVLDVVAHLGDQLLDAGEALLAPQTLDEGDAQSRAVEVLL